MKRPHLGKRLISVEFPKLVLDRLSQFGGLGRRSHHERHVPIAVELLIEWLVNLSGRGLIKSVLQHVADDAHDLAKSLRAVRQVDPLAHRVLAWKVALSHRLIDDDHSGGALAVKLGEQAAFRKRDPHGLEVPVTDGIVVHGRSLAGRRRRTPLDDEAQELIPHEGQGARDSGGLDAGQRRCILDQSLEECCDLAQLGVLELGKIKIDQVDALGTEAGIDLPVSSPPDPIGKRTLSRFRRPGNACCWKVFDPVRTESDALRSAIDAAALSSDSLFPEDRAIPPEGLRE